MTVHLFGAVSSPSCASFALRKTAEDNQSDFPAAVAQTVKENFYVDDCLKSMGSEEEASTMVKDLMSLCQRGGFTLTKWISNNRTMLQALPEEHRAKELAPEEECYPSPVQCMILSDFLRQLFCPPKS